MTAKIMTREHFVSMARARAAWKAHELEDHDAALREEVRKLKIELAIVRAVADTALSSATKVVHNARDKHAGELAKVTQERDEALNNPRDWSYDKAFGEGEKQGLRLGRDVERDEVLRLLDDGSSCGAEWAARIERGDHRKAGGQ